MSFSHSLSCWSRTGVVLLFAAWSGALWGQLQPSFDAFDPNANGNVFAVVVQPDGKILIGGGFDTLRPNRFGAGHVRFRIARLNADGSVDATFTPRIDGGEVRAIALQPDGKIIVGGKFDKAWGSTDQEPAVRLRNCLVRFNADGSIDDTFNPHPKLTAAQDNYSGTGYANIALVRAIAVQPNGQILIGGAFTGFQNGETFVARDRIARLNADGSLDPTFTAGADNVVQALAVQPDGRILVGGGFSNFRPTGGEMAARKYLVRLEANGTRDATFTAEANNRVLAFKMTVDNRILVGGEFTQLTIGGTTTTRTFAARLLASGALDTTFDPAPNAAVEAFGIQADGKIVLGGRFTQLRPNGGASSFQSYAARVTHDGIVDTDFALNTDAPVVAIAMQSDTSVLLGGYFTAAASRFVGSTARGHITRVQADGILEVGFAPQTGGRVRQVIRYPDGKILVIGAFNAFAGITRSNIVRLNADGSVDTTFDPQVNGAVTTAALLSTGDIIIGGNFTRVGVEARAFLARIDENGDVDEEFNPRPNSAVNAMLVLGDKLVIGGGFTTLQPGAATTPTARIYLARLNLANGSVDETFQADCGAAVSALLRISDTSFVVGGDFTSITPKGAREALFRRYLARITGDGVVDSDFDPRPTGPVTVLTAQGDKILVGGNFTGFFPASATALIARRNLGRLEANGTPDAFDPSPNAVVYAIASQTDNSVVVGGAFTEFLPNGATTATGRTFLAWLNQDGTLRPDHNYQADNIVWSLASTGNAVVVGGQFESLSKPGAASILTEDHIAQLDEDGQPDPAFVPSVGTTTGEVNTIVAQRDGQLLVGGVFTDVAGTRSTNLTRLSVTGAPDTTFGNQFGGPVHALFVRNPSDTSVTTSGPIVWLTPAGGLRSGFDTSWTANITGTIQTVLRLQDGRVLLGGAFATNYATMGGNLIRLQANGVLDASFNPSPNGQVTSLVLDSENRVLVGGEFTRIGGLDRSYLARLTSTGEVDTTFDVKANGMVHTIVRLGSLSTSAPDTFYIGGDFVNVTPQGATSVTTRPYIARFTAAGALETAFAPALNRSVYAILPQAGDRVLVGGNFDMSGTTTRTGIARFNSTNGDLDTTFSMGMNGFVEDFAVQSDGKILICGSFTNVVASTSSSVLTRQYVARFSINSSGGAVVDETFQPAVGSVVHSIDVDSQDRILIGGEFSGVTDVRTGRSTIRRFVARFRSDGTNDDVLDDTFNPQPNGAIVFVQAQDDGAFLDSVILGGSFTRLLPEALVFAGGDFATVGTAPFPNLVRLNNDGSADPAYVPQPDGMVRALAGLPDGRMFVAGAFANFGPAEALVPRGRLAILSSTGALDPAFTTAADGPVHALSLTGGDQIVIGGNFANVGGAAHVNLARIGLDGTVDATFNPSTNGLVETVVVQPDGKVLVAGAFTTINGAAQPYLARLNANGTHDAAFAPVLNGAVSAVALQADGGMQIGGAFTTVNGSARPRLARLTATGALDPALTIDFADGEVRAIMPLPDGRSVVGGTFRVVGNRPRYLLTRIPAAGGATQNATVNPARTQLTWTNGGTRAEFSAVEFAVSTDRTTWTELGAGTRTGASGVWQATVPALPADQLYYVRARATLPSSRNYSTGRFETQWQFFNDQIAGPRSIGAVDGGSGPSGGGGSGGSSGGGSGDTGGSGSGGGTGGSGGGSSGGSGGGTGGGSSGGASLPAYHLINFSVRARPAETDKLITGFVIRAGASERVVLRAVGPGLAEYDVPGVMNAPVLELRGADGALLATSTAWNGDAGLMQAFSDVGAFPLDPTSADAAQAPLLPPGTYTTLVSPSDGDNGIALAEVYFDGSSEGAGGLANLSARGPAGDGDAVLIVGFVVGGDQPRRFLIRGVGPGLLPYGVTDALTDPAVLVYDGAGATVAANDDWQTQSGAVTADEVVTAATSSGAFALTGGSKDAALVLTLAPGSYTAHVVGTAAGTGLVEVYELP